MGIQTIRFKLRFSLPVAVRKIVSSANPNTVAAAHLIHLVFSDADFLTDPQPIRIDARIERLQLRNAFMKPAADRRQRVAAIHHVNLYVVNGAGR